MASLGYAEILIPAILLLLYCVFRYPNSRSPRNWPLVGMLPMIILNFHNIGDKFAEILSQHNGTFLYKGVWFATLDMLFTSDPKNVQHILSTNFNNYPKGPKSKRIFDVLGDVLFNADLDEWKGHRKMVHALFSDSRFHRSMKNINRDIVEKGLIPVLDHVSRQSLMVDFQDLFQRLTHDTTCSIVTGYKPSSLYVGFPEVSSAKAIDDATEVVFWRFLTPEWLWKVQRWLGVGGEKKMKQAWQTLDDMADKYITLRREDMEKEVMSKEDHGETSFDTIKCYLTEDKIFGSKPHPYSVIRDTIVGLIFAGRDTTSATLAWFFWHVLKDPSLESGIRRELESKFPVVEAEKPRLFHIEELNNLAYLHGAFCETLRLYPPVPFQCRVPVQSETLPSGHHVNSKMKVIMSSYAMGRMTSIWGDDCLEFKPERWISEKGMIKHERQNKLLAFSAGPRTCPGKDIALTIMKIVAATIIHNYHVQLVEGHPVSPATSIILRMEHGLGVRVTKRWA